MKYSRLLIFLPIAALVVACKGQSDPQGDAMAPEAVDVTVAFEDIVDIPMAKVDGKAGNTGPTRKTNQTRSAGKAGSTGKPAPAAKKNTSAPETIYVETEGAQGRVWGHVTMRGDRGTGTIHDWDENTLTVSVTRHGNELFAVDQNSRQYVFRLKQNKQQ